MAYRIAVGLILMFLAGSILKYKWRAEKTSWNQARRSRIQRSKTEMMMMMMMMMIPAGDRGAARCDKRSWHSTHSADATPFCWSIVADSSAAASKTATEAAWCTVVVIDASPAHQFVVVSAAARRRPVTSSLSSTPASDDTCWWSVDEWWGEFVRQSAVAAAGRVDDTHVRDTGKVSWPCDRSGR